MSIMNKIILGDSWNYILPILVPSSTKRIATQISKIAKLNGRKKFILRVFVILLVPARNYLFKVSNLSTGIRCESYSILRMSMLTIFNINDVSGVVLVSLLLKTQSEMLYVMLTFEKTQKYYFLNRMKYIEGSLMKSSGKISWEHQKLLVRKKVDFKVKWQKNMQK